MLTRQPKLKTALTDIVNQRSFTSLNCQTTGYPFHVRQLFDESPDPSRVSIVRSMVDSLRRKRPLRALGDFKSYVKDHFVDGVALALALKACAKDPFRGSQIHGFAITTGLISRITVCNSLMNMYSKSGQFGKALAIFEDLGCPDIVSWNTVLSGFGKSEDALRFVLRMSSNGVAFDAFSYTTSFSFCLEPKDFVFARQLHSCVVKVALDCDTFVGNALITMYSRSGKVEDGRRVFEEMPRKDRISWSAMISGYAQDVMHGLEAILVFVLMVREGIEPDHVAFTGVVAACGHGMHLLPGRQIHSLSMKSGFAEHLSVGNVLMSMYSKSGEPKETRLVFESMDDHNVVSWTTMITVYEEDAVLLFKEMLLQGVDPNEVTLISLLSAITNRDLVEQGKMVHGFCKKSGFLSEPNVCNSLITMYANFESMDESLQVFHEIQNRDIIAWNALISGYTQNGLCQEAVEMFAKAFTESKPSEYTFGSVLSAISSAEDVPLVHGQKCHSQILKHGLSIDAIVSSALLDMYAKRGSISDSLKVFIETPQRNRFSWTAIISAYARHGDFESVMSWFNEMELQGVRPDSITFLSVLTACARKGMVDTGRRLFKLMVRDYQIEPTREHYSCMVDMLGRAGRLAEAEALLDNTPGGPGLTMMQSLLGACRIHGNANMGERVADALMETEFADSGSYVLMSNIYADKGQWEKVADVRRAMRAKGVRKVVGFSWLEAGHGEASVPLHKFSSGDKSHALSEDIFWMAKFLGAEMKFARELRATQWLVMR